MKNRFVVILLLFIIIFSTVASQTNLINAQPSNISFGKSVSGTIERGEVDSYKFFASAGDPIFIRIRSGFDPGLDPQIKLFSPNGSEIQGISQSNPTGTQTTVSCTLNETGEYTILASDKSGQRDGSYGLFVYNFNHPDTVPVLELDKTTTGNLDFIGKVDCYRIPAIASNSLNIRAVGNQGKSSFYLHLKLFDSN